MKLEVKTGIRIEIHNSDCVLGCHFNEEDWSIQAIGSSYEEAIESIIPVYLKSNIYPDSNYVDLVEYVIYNGEQHVLKISKAMAISDSVVNDIKSHPLFNKLLKEKQRKDLARKAQDIKEKQKKKEIEERKLLERLQKKYY